MGVRGELFSTKVSLQNRTYFFNVKENRLGDLYLNIVESKNRDEGGFERQSVILFADDLQDFLQGFDEALKILEKAQREKRRGKKTEVYPSRSPGPGKESRSSGRTRREEGPRDRPRSERPRGGERPRDNERPRGDRPSSARPRSERPRSDRPRSEKKPGARPPSRSEGKRKVVVRKPVKKTRT